MMDRGYKVDRNIHPKDIANIFSLLSFFYIWDTIRKGNQKDLQEDDICQVMRKLQSKKLGHRIEKHWDHEKNNHSTPSLLRVILRCFGIKILFIGIMQLCTKLPYTLITPWALSNFVSYFNSNQTEISTGEAYLYGIMVIAMNTAMSIYDHHYCMMRTELVMEVMTSVSSLMYRKAIRLSSVKASELSTGKIVTAITKDVATLEEAIFYGNEIWVDFVQTCVIFILLYSKIGLAACSGFALILLSIPIQVYISWKVYLRRWDSNTKTDERLQLTKEVLSSIRIIKMYTWQKFFGKKLIHARKIELRKLKLVFIFRVISFAVGTLTTKLSYFLIVITYSWLGNALTAGVVYFLSLCFQRLRSTITFIIPHATYSIGEVFASLNRLTLILNAEEYKEGTRKVIRSPNPSVNFRDVDVNIESRKILKNITFRLTPGLNIIFGPVGSGKSTLLKTILGEYSLSGGKLNVECSISYASQNPWLFPSSVRQNILFGEPYNEVRYKTVLAVTALSFDLNILAEGDGTILTDCGVNLSKGQQARINLARAVYKDSDVYLLDDCLSSLDKQVENYIFKHCIKTYLKDKLVLLVTHTTQHLNEASTVAEMSQGTIRYSGKPSDLPSTLDSSDNSHQKVEEETKEKSEEQLKDTDELIDGNLHDNDKSELLGDYYSSKNIYHETLKIGTVPWKTYSKYCKYGGGIFIFLLGVMAYIANEASSSVCQKILSEWVNLEETITVVKEKQHNITVYGLNKPIANIFYTTNFEELNNHSSIQRTYSSTPLNVSRISGHIGMSNNSSIERNITLEEMLQLSKAHSITYTLVIMMMCFFSFLAPSILVYFNMRASKNVHKSMVNNVVGASMSFFDKNLIGTVLNRFSKDLQVLDELVPMATQAAIGMVATLSSIIILVASVSRIFLVNTVILAIVSISIGRYYIRAGRNLRRLDSATRSPIIGHVNATVDGLITIRAYGAQPILIDEFDKHQDLYTSAHHLMEIAARAMAITLQVNASVFLSAMVFRFLISEKDQSSGNVGLAITQALLLSTFLQWGTRQIITLENEMTSMERALEYTEIEQERESGSCPGKWPSKGCIKFQNVNLTYRSNKEQVLKNLNFTINSKDKIGIVGRTGAGKSSILVALFRLYDVEGDISIDDVNIRTLGLDYLRSHIAIIPQDPILFPGSIRSNLDCLGHSDDNEMWQALTEVNLKSLISNLDQDIMSSGFNFSVGQRQLICIARAIIRKCTIVILDEATANMDEDMDNFIQKKIEKLFESCTILIVAHRLHSVMNCNKVMVMDKGEINEFDNPQILLEDKNSCFYKLVNH